MKQARPSRTSTPIVLAALAVFVVLTALAGCTMVGESLTGVRVRAEGPTSCVKDCNDLYKTLYENERKLHDENIEACQALAQPDKGTCLEAEAARHEAAMTELGDAKVACQNDCHRQGSGTAG